jgi:hypothetical protein
MSERDGSHVRFRDGDGLVEYEGSPKKETKTTRKAAPAEASPVKPKIARSASVSGAIVSSPVEVKKKKQVSPAVKAPSTTPDEGSKSSAVPEPAGASTVPDVQPTPLTPTSTGTSQENESVDETKLKFFSAFQVSTTALFLPFPLQSNRFTNTA